MPWLIQNWQMKVAAVIAAAAAWFFVMSTEKTRIILAVPLEYVGLSDTRVLVRPRAEVVDVELQAVRWVAARLSPETVRVRVDLRDLPEGDSVLSLTPAHVVAPRGAAVLRITPARLYVLLVPAVEETVRVAPQVQGAPAPGFVVGRVVADPPTVRIKGPQFTIEGRDEVMTTPVDVSGMRQTVVRAVGLALPDSAYVSGEQTVTVTVEIRPEEAMQGRGASQ